MDRLQNIVKGIKKIGETDDLKHLHWNAWDKACFSCNAEFYDRKKLAKETISNKALKERAHEIATNLRYDGFKAEYQVWSMFFDKKIVSGARVSVNE